MWGRGRGRREVKRGRAGRAGRARISSRSQWGEAKDKVAVGHSGDDSCQDGKLSIPLFLQ